MSPVLEGALMVLAINAAVWLPVLAARWLGRHP